LLSGFTDNYVKIEIPFQEGLLNTVQPLLLHRLQEDSVAAARAEGRNQPA
jgi:hypothetical protein